MRSDITTIKVARGARSRPHEMAKVGRRFKMRQGLTMRPPAIGRGAPVVPGNEIGRPRAVRAAR